MRRECLRLTYLLAALLARIFRVAAQEGAVPEPGLVPEAPRAWQFRQVTMPAPSLSTGAATFDIPLYDIEVDGLTIPLALRYHAGGIKVDDDFQPVGYGWTLTPPLRITRQILGRPDGLFPFVGDAFIASYENCWRCMHRQFDTNAHEPDRYDAEHDIFTVHLADKSFSMIFDNGKFVTPQADEYHIKTDAKISYIKITDPKGNVYNFNQHAAFTDWRYNTEWLLTSINTLSGKEIKIEWEKKNRFTYWYHPSVIVHFGTSYGGAPEGQYVPPCTLEEHTNIKGVCDISKIDFGDGCVQFDYGSYSMLESIKVTSSEGHEVRQISLLHLHSPEFLSGVSFDNGSTYSFEYYGNPSIPKLSQDWWGYHNGAKNNDLYLSPAGKITKPKAISFIGGDRSVNAAYTADRMLKKAVYPTGAITEWVYETHRFSPRQSTFSTIDLKLEEPHVFSEGGGVRVKSMTLYNGRYDQAPIKRSYVYGPDGNGLANCTALPFLHTFVTMNKRMDFYYSMIGTESVPDRIDPYEEYNAVISRQSDYMAYRPGEIPIWYSQVKEIEGEGYTVYNFEKLWDDNHVGRIEQGPVPDDIYTVFSPGIVEKSREVYDSSGRKLSTQSKEYEVNDLSSSRGWGNHSIKRRYYQTTEQLYSPDFNEQGYVYKDESTLNGGHTHVIQCGYDNYIVSGYLIAPNIERLVSETFTEHTPTGDIGRTTSYEYVPGTSLPSRQTVVCGGDSLVTSYSYTATSGDIASEMKAANVVGTVTGASSKFGDAVSSYSYDMGQFGHVFKPRRVWRRRGSGEAWRASEYLWNSDGTLDSRTGADGIVTSWSWDPTGRHPVASTVGGTLTNRAEWKHLVGVTAITGPDSVRQDYSYDAAGRLDSVKHSGRLLEIYAYNVSQDGDNFVFNRKFSTATNSSMYFSRFDALGRQWGEFAELPSGTVASLTEYDSMRRPWRSWSAVPVASRSANADEIRTSASSWYGDSEPYTELRYEASPRRLVTSAAKAGAARHGEDGGVRTEIYANDLTTHACTRYVVTGEGVAASGLWPKGSLKVTAATDEDGIRTEKFEDMRGLTVCERRAGLSTHYVYDGYGDLRYILPPGLEGTHRRTDAAMQDLAFWNDYDSRGQLILAREPGRRAARMRYDAAGRLVAEQGFNHPSGTWRLYFYDGCGRQVLAVDCRMGEGEATAFASTIYCASASASGTLQGYAISPTPPLSAPEVVWAKYYDNYDFITALSLQDELSFRDPLWIDRDVIWDSIPMLKSRSQFIYNQSFELGSPLGKLTGLYTGAGYESYYYDKMGMEGQRCATSTGYNRGRRTTTYTHDLKPAKVSYRYGDSCCLHRRDIIYTYDNAGREVKRKIVNYTPKPVISGELQPIDSVIIIPRKPLAASPSKDDFILDSAVICTEYDRAGRPSTIVQGANTTTQTYECNGWPLRSTTTKGMRVVLSDSLGYGASGRITSRRWNGHRYAYSYTPEGFLAQAAYSGAGGADYSAQYEYDERGNILWLKRKGITDVTPSGEYAYGLADEITATVSGNHPTALRVRSEAEEFSRRTGFGRDIDATLTYDECGRLYSDESRGIASIEYDNNGYPRCTVFTSGAVHTDLYDGLGNHISTTYERGGVPAGSRRYTGDGHVIRGGERDTLEMARFPGGFFDWLGNAHYYIADYRGSVAAVTNSSGGVEHYYNYYPYGELWIEPDETQHRFDILSKAVNRYTFGDKERLTADGIHEYDQTARRYAPSYPFFTTPDAMASKTPWLSPYAFCAANPISYIDPTGNDIYNFDAYGKYIDKITNDEYDKIVIHKSKKEAVSLKLERGTIENVSTGKHELNDVKQDVLAIQVRGDDAGQKIFEFFADNIKNEYSLAKTGKAGENGLNFVTTSHEEASEKGMSELIVEQLQFGYTLREFSHSHPNNNEITYQTDDKGKLKGDHLLAHTVSDHYRYNGSISFKVYLPGSQRYIEYYNSKWKKTRNIR